MGSTACCMSRHPPSPDGIAPRPALRSPPKITLGASSNELLPLSWSSGSPLSPPEDAAVIQAIFEEDKLDSESEHRDKASSNKASTAISAVKNRLKKHLSKDSGITVSKRHSRSSVGTSEEEVERRAELRRIRQKRIQEELSSEGLYDDDAKSVSTVEAATNMFPNHKEASWTPGDSLPSPMLILPSLTPNGSTPTTLDTRPVNLFNHKGPLLEALYYGLMSPSPATSTTVADMYFPDNRATMAATSVTRSRRYSSPAVSSPEFEIPEPIVYRPTRKRSSLPELPKAPMLQPQRLPSIVEPPKSSWRLSFSAGNRGEHLRKLSQGAIPPAFLSQDLMPGRQPPRRWLHSQGLRSSSQAVVPSNTSDLDILASHTLTCNASHDFGGVDGVGEITNTLHLHEMGISQRLASKGLQSPCSSPQLSSLGSRTHERGVSDFSTMTRSTQRRRPRCLQQNTTDSLPLSERIPEAWGNIVESGTTAQDGTSSFYPSANNSIQPSPQSSRFNLFALLSGNRSTFGFTAFNNKSGLTIDDVADIGPPSSTFKSPPVPETPVGRCSIFTPRASSTSLPLPSVGYHRRPMVDTSSTIVSETESFREREVELSVVRTRFAAAEACRSPSSPRSSKFREEFDFTISTPGDDGTPCRSFSFSRLAKFAARSLDGPFERKLGIPMTPHAPAYEPPELLHHHKAGKAPLTSAAGQLEDGSVLGFWENAVKRNVEPKTKDIAGKLHIPRLKGGRLAGNNSNIRKKSHASNHSNKKKQALKGLGWGIGDESEEEDNPEDDWEAELNRVAQKAKGKSRAIVKKYNEPDRRYPASWSKFSSHDREIRSASAKANDNVAVQDFATDGSELVDKERKTLREKIQKKLIAQYDKQTTTDVQNNTAGTFGRRSSMRPAGDLEYPELEVLPLHNVSLMSHEEIAEHVEETLKEEELAKKEEELDAIFGPAVVKRKDTIKEEVKRIGRKMTPKRVRSNKTSNSKTSASGSLKSTTKASEATASKAPSKTDVSVQKGPPARRGPVARKPGENLTPSIPKPAPIIAPPVIMLGRSGGTKVFMDGSMDHGETDSITLQIEDSVTDNADVSIADPNFYSDCIVTQTPGPEMGLYSDGSEDEIEYVGESSPNLTSGKGKYKTWGGKDWDNYRHQDRYRRSLGTLLLRQSTDEVLCELEKLEKIERENALRLAEEAWGGV